MKSKSRRIIVGITGATGITYAARVLEMLRAAEVAWAARAHPVPRSGADAFREVYDDTCHGYDTAPAVRRLPGPPATRFSWHGADAGRTWPG